MKAKVGIICFISFLVGSLYSQAGDISTERKATIEELYLQSGDMMIIRELAFVQDREMKLESLKMIDEKIKDGTFGTGDPAAHFVLDYLSEEGIGRTVKVGGRTTNYFPMIRRESARLLGELGGENAKDTLLNVLLTDDDMMVKAEAVYALGLIGENENGEVSKAISWALKNQNQAIPNDNFATASLYAIEKILDKNGSIDDREIYSAVVQIAQNTNYVKPVKEKAYQVIAKLRNAQ